MRADAAAFAVQTPATLAEALALLAREPGAWTPLAGGTDLMVDLEVGRRADRGFLDLSRLPELRGITEDEATFTLGALTTYTEVREAAPLHRWLPNLVRSARATGARAIQNRGTLGGNVVNASPAADAVPSLLAYGAEVALASVRGTRWVPLDRFFLAYKQRDLAGDELLTHLRLAKPEGRTFHYVRKVGTRAAQAIAKVSLAAFAQVAEGRIAELRLALGAVAPVPLRARRAEAVLRGAALEELPVAEAREALGSDIAPIDDLRSTARYRAVVAGNLLEEALRELVRLG